MHIRNAFILTFWDLQILGVNSHISARYWKHSNSKGHGGVTIYPEKERFYQKV